LGLNSIAKIIKIKPLNVTIGAKVILRKLNMSGLNSVPVVEPVMSTKPKTIMAKPMAINMILILPSVKRVLFSIKIEFLKDP